MEKIQYTTIPIDKIVNESLSKYINSCAENLKEYSLNGICQMMKSHFLYDLNTLFINPEFFRDESYLVGVSRKLPFEASKTSIAGSISTYYNNHIRGPIIELDYGSYPKLSFQKIQEYTVLKFYLIKKEEEVIHAIFHIIFNQNGVAEYLLYDRSIYKPTYSIKENDFIDLIQLHPNKYYFGYSEIKSQYFNENTVLYFTESIEGVNQNIPVEIPFSTILNSLLKEKFEKNFTTLLSYQLHESGEKLILKYERQYRAHRNHRYDYQGSGNYCLKTGDLNIHSDETLTNREDFS